MPTMNYLESSVRVRNGEFPFIRFGTGKKNFVMLAGMSMAGLTGLGAAVSVAYRDFSEEYTVYVFDRLRILPDDASVRSMSQDTAEAMRALEIEKADVMGASQGGMIALYLAIDHPELVSSLVLCSSCCYQNDAAKEIFFTWSTLADQSDGNGIYRDFFKRVYTYPNESALALCLDTGTAEQCRRFGILARACYAFDCRDELNKLQCPALVLGSAQDRVLGSSSSPELAERLGCECFIYRDFGHAVYDEAPDFRQRILDFLHKITA